MKAEQALQKSFAISSGNFDGERAQVWLLLGKHEFAAALEQATMLNQRMLDDVMIYVFLTDANIVKLLPHARKIVLKVGDSQTVQLYFRHAAELNAPESTAAQRIHGE